MHTTPVMETIAEMMMGYIERTFESEGRRGGGSWKNDSAEWAARKARQGLDPRIGHATLALRRSMTIRGDANQDLRVSHNMVSLSSYLPYAGTQQVHRPFVKFTFNDRVQIRNTIRDYLVEAFRRA
jgi:phage gpG-like protein